jgi:3-hydroxybutyryl-CoA dehydrogenase
MSSGHATADTNETVAVIGAGLMGTGIAEAAAAGGKLVVVHEPDEAPLERSREALAASLTRGVSGGAITSTQREAILARVDYTTDPAALADADAAIEAITENARIKADLFAELDARLPHAQFIASNTSAIPIAQLAASTERRGRVLGVHFFSPVPVMKLVEIVPSLDTSPETIDTAEAFVAALGKHPIRTKDRSGFVVNMLLVPYLTAAMKMYEEGFATREDIDDGMKLGCGHPMGPLRLSDFIGLDVLHSVCESLHDEFKRPEFAPTPLLKRLVVAGHLGKKTGRGFYVYAK